MADDEASPASAEPDDEAASAPAEPKATLPDSEVRRRMRTLDATERRWGFIAGGVVLALSVVLLPDLLHTTYGPPNSKPTLGRCARGLHLVGKTCETVYHPRDFALQFGLLVVLGVVLLLAVWREKRSLTIFAAMFVGLASAFIGVSIVLLVGLGYGGWLLARSWRLQRYGTTNAKEVRKVATERAEARRAERRASKGTTRDAAKDVDASPARPSPTASKRYTPKAKPRRR